MTRRFNIALNSAVLTTRFVLHENKPILSVFHHEEDGIWEFIGDDICADDSDYLVISLDEIINLDTSILEISELPAGKSAQRAGKNQPWIIR
ncbi:hypothetical protein [Chitinophaga sp.]|uniref:hypothetical protein n=1 Tax=Chitinophaga sp. TaxID=1869181 RepID=UPI002622BB8F|nr:hypothetical protein [uncultured Chitinophaga sp.]